MKTEKPLLPIILFSIAVLCLALLSVIYHTYSVPAMSNIEEPSYSPLAQLAQSRPTADLERLINHNAYNSIADINFEVEQLYIKTFPTYNEEGQLISRDEFEKHQSGVRDFNPTLNAHIWQGHPDDPEGQEERLGFNDAEYNCTIRVRGNSTRGALFKSFKVKLTEQDATLFAYDSLNFNKNYYDMTRTQSKVCMDLMQLLKSGMVSLETRFVQLFINDVQLDGGETGFVDQGIYVWIEQPNKDFLLNHGLDPNGTIYKSNYFDFEMSPAIRSEDHPLYDEEAFNEVMEATANSDNAKLIRMLEDVNNLSLDYHHVFEKYFDEENYLTWVATNILFGLKDTLTHNLLIYSPSTSEKWYLLPWDYDEALVYSEVEQWDNRFFQQFGVHYFWTLPIHQRYFRIAGNNEKLLAKMDELLATVYTKENFEALAQGYIQALEEYLTQLPDARTRTSFETISTEMLMRYQTMLNNRERYELTLEYPSCISVQKPEKTEEGWLFRWDAAFDHQRDTVTYEIILSKEYKEVTSGGLSYEQVGHEQTSVFFHQSGLTRTSIVIPELPAGPIFYRVLVHDSEGHIQYPRNVTTINPSGGTGSRLRYYAMGYFVNE